MSLDNGRTSVDIDEASDTKLGPDVITRKCLTFWGEAKIVDADHGGHVDGGAGPRNRLKQHGPSRRSNVMYKRTAVSDEGKS